MSEKRDTRLNAQRAAKTANDPHPVRRRSRSKFQSFARGAAVGVFAGAEPET
jgi:hypothetical protein